MPIYEYRCEACGAQEEKLESLSAPEIHACGTCGAESGMKRQVSAPAFTFSGSGWYASDYAGKGKDASGSEPPSPPSCCGGGCACAGK